MRKASSDLEKEMKELRAKSSGLDKAWGLKKENASSELENEIKQLRAQQGSGLKKEKSEKNKLQAQK